MVTSTVEAHFSWSKIPSGKLFMCFFPFQHLFHHFLATKKSLIVVMVIWKSPWKVPIEYGTVQNIIYIYYDCNTIHILFPYSIVYCHVLPQVLSPSSSNLPSVSHGFLGIPVAFQMWRSPRFEDHLPRETMGKKKNIFLHVGSYPPVNQHSHRNSTIDSWFTMIYIVP